VDINPREFLKKCNTKRIDLKLQMLNRVKALNNETNNECKEVEANRHVNVSWSNEIQMSIKKKGKQKQIFNLKADRDKAFKIKKMFNELPTMENLKKRKPNVYKEHYLCPRCEQKEETLEHLWSCPRADNDILELQMLAREKLTKLLRKSKKIKNIDDTMEEIFPFLKIEKQLKGYTKESSIFYGNIEKKSSLQQYTYVWDGINSMDNILKGWIPKNLISTLRKHLVNDNKLTVKNILTKWVNKVNIMFFDLIWKKRNEDMLQWEHRNNIDIKDKKNSSLKQK